MKIVSGIYQLTNTANGKIYIGSSVDIHKRIRNHITRLRNNKHPSHHLQNAYNKYGHVFISEIVEICEKNDMSKVEFADYLIDREKYWIETKQCYLNNIGYNTQRDPKANYNTGKEHGLRTAGDKNPMYGKTHSEESRRKISEHSKGRVPPNLGIPHTEEARRKIGLKSIGRKKSQKALDKFREIMLSDANPMRRLEVRMKVSIPVAVYNLDGSYVGDFYCIKEVSRSLNIPIFGVRMVLSKRYPSYKGYLFYYREFSCAA